MATDKNPTIVQTSIDFPLTRLFALGRSLPAIRSVPPVYVDGTRSLLARALVEHGFSAIFDVGLMVTDDQIRFTSDFASELLRINRTALHLYIDEADIFAPQMLETRQQKLCLGTVSGLETRRLLLPGVRGVGPG